MVTHGTFCIRIIQLRNIKCTEDVTTNAVFKKQIG